MDKLKPILDNKFWILLFLAILLPTIGWFVASGSFAEEIEKREADLKSAFDSLNFPSDPPNKSWSDQAQKIVEEEQARLDRTSIALWNTQKQAMTWPAGVQEFMEGVPYEGTIPPRARENYRRVNMGYEKQLNEIEAILEPYNPVTRTGKVLVNRDAYTHVPLGTWQSGPPTSKAMWDAQIDAWLVQSIFQSIATMNRADEKLSDATIVQVLELKLRGGIRDYSASAGTSAAGGTTGAPAGGGEGYDNMYSGAPGGEGYGSSGGGASGKMNVKLQFDLSDELGPDAGARGGTSGAGEYGTAPSTGGESPTTPTAPAGPRRYVDDAENLPFRTRGFVLGVVMHHRYLNDFLAELSGSKWPIQVIRVHQQMNNPDSLALAGRTGTGARGSSRGLSTGGTGFGAPSGFGTGAEYGTGADTAESGFGAPGMTRMGAGTPGASSGGFANDLMVRQALSDPHLATVWIGGLITLFKPVDEPEATPADPAEESLETLPETTEPSTEAPASENLPTPASDTETPANSTDDPNANPTGTGKPELPQPEADDTSTAPENPETVKPPATPE